MAMKILNQFIDDFVGVFQYRFMDTFQYFKERKKSKYLGDRFEEWVVKNSNISKDGYSDLCDKKIFWRLLDWRGDKYIEGYRPLSSSSPDLLMECVTTTSTIHEVGDIIAVECKWRSKIGFYLDIKDIEKYEGYMNSNLLNRPIKNLFYVFGFGWCGDSPESVYVVPAREYPPFSFGSAPEKSSLVCAISVSSGITFSSNAPPSLTSEYVVSIDSRKI